MYFTKLGIVKDQSFLLVMDLPGAFTVYVVARETQVDSISEESHVGLRTPDDSHQCPT